MSSLVQPPLPDARSAGAASDQALGRLDWPDLSEALSAHPQIGEHVGGPGRESSWSRQEQASTAIVTARDELAEGNRAYEQRFGHVFLICATGLGTEEMLQALRSRLGNDPIAEREVVRGELRGIVALRLARALR